MNWRAEVEALREAAERNKAQYPVECERLQGFPDGFTIPDEAQWPEDWIRVVHKERRLARADERERVKARVEGLAIFAADNGIPFNLADYYEAIEGTDDE